MTRRFGTFTVDRDQRQVRRGEDVIHVTRKAFDLLTLLIEESPRVVPKAELHERLWPGTFVSDSALVALVKELRRVLREPSSDESYIRTSHGVGYAFSGQPDSGQTISTAGKVQHWVVVGGRHIQLHEGENVIGREPAARVCLDDAGVSRRHARIVVTGEEALVEDLDSKNGTTAQGVPVAGRVRLVDGDGLSLGPVVIRYRMSHAGVSTETLGRSE
jgi:DNA-binding winged helix-turn-helix (wHTH) protein